MKRWLGVLLFMLPIVAIALYVAGFFVFTEFIPDPHPSVDTLDRRKFPSRILKSFWRPMVLYDRYANPGVMWIDQDGKYL